ncbi:MAG: HD domain-containing protein, partial [Isosphaeraceae bacterium]
MADERIRRQLAFLAAQMMYLRTETEYFTAKRKAAKQLGVEYRHRPGDLPSNKEIRDQIQAMARIHEGPKRLEHLRDMRLDALRLMRLLARFRPRLIGSVRTGHVRKGSDIDIHIFCDSQALVTDTLDELGLQYDVEHKRIIKYGEERTFTHIHIHDNHNYELTLYPEDKVHYVFKSSITGKAIERASIAELEALLREEDPELNLEAEVERLEDHIDRFALFRMLLEPLEGVKQSPKYHPEGDALYHSLQVFELARDERPYDEEFLLAALLHDVGKAIDPSDHVGTALEALEGSISERTAWLIEHHMEAQASVLCGVQAGQSSAQTTRNPAPPARSRSKTGPPETGTPPAPAPAEPQRPAAEALRPPESASPCLPPPQIDVGPGTRTA